MIIEFSYSSDNSSYSYHVVMTVHDAAFLERAIENGAIVPVRGEKNGEAIMREMTAEEKIAALVDYMQKYEPGKIEKIERYADVLQVDRSYLRMRNDGVDYQPGIIIYHAVTGKPLHETHYSKGLRCSSLSRTKRDDPYAFYGDKIFDDEGEGRLVQARYFTNDQLTNSNEAYNAAVLIFDRAGRVRQLCRYTQNELNDISFVLPAVEWLDEKGDVVRAKSVKAGIYKGELSEAEICGINAVRHEAALEQKFRDMLNIRSGTSNGFKILKR